MIRNDDQAGHLTKSAENNSVIPDPKRFVKILYLLVVIEDILECHETYLVFLPKDCALICFCLPKEIHKFFEIVEKLFEIMDKISNDKLKASTFHE